MKKSGNMRRTLCAVALLIALTCAMPAMADWASAESPDFALDTTVPEPCTSLLVLGFAAMLAARSRHTTAR